MTKVALDTVDGFREHEGGVWQTSSLRFTTQKERNNNTSKIVQEFVIARVE